MIASGIDVLSYDSLYSGLSWPLIDEMLRLVQCDSLDGFFTKHSRCTKCDNVWHLLLSLSYNGSLLRACRRLTGYWSSGLEGEGDLATQLVKHFECRAISVLRPALVNS